MAFSCYGVAATKFELPLGNVPVGHSKDARKTVENFPHGSVEQGASDQRNVRLFNGKPKATVKIRQRSPSACR